MQRAETALIVGTALLGLLTDTSLPVAVRGVVGGVLFPDRMIIESCISKTQRTVCVPGAFGADPELLQMLADALDREIQVVDQSHLPASRFGRVTFICPGC